MQKSDELVDFLDYPVIECDGCADVYTAGERTYYTLFRFQKFNGEMRRVIVGRIQRPRVTREEQQELLQRAWLEAEENDRTIAN